MDTAERIEIIYEGNAADHLDLALGSIMYFMPAQTETAAQVIAALARFGKAGSVFDLRKAA